MRKTQREPGTRVFEFKKQAVPGSTTLDPVVQSWLDNVIIPILLKKLRQEWNAEKAA
jgi:hypothetical protein